MLLALDTASPHGSVAVAEGAGGSILAARPLADRSRQAATLTPLVAEVLASAGVERSELTAIVVGEGPGSFTGVRIAAATAKGLARALRIPLYGIPSLLSAAVSDLKADGGAGVRAMVRYTLFDARADRVYGACYRMDDSGITPVIPPHGGTVGEVLESDLPRGVAFVGDGALRHRALLKDAGHTVLEPPAGVPNAEALLTAFSLLPALEPVPSLDTWEPRYVRASNAEREWKG